MLYYRFCMKTLLFFDQPLENATIIKHLKLNWVQINNNYFFSIKLQFMLWQPSFSWISITPYLHLSKAKVTKELHRLNLQLEC
jgi:hypothetical protein